jgi:hypothetical protein
MPSQPPVGTTRLQVYVIPDRCNGLLGGVQVGRCTDIPSMLGIDTLSMEAPLF